MLRNICALCAQRIQYFLRDSVLLILFVERHQRSICIVVRVRVAVMMVVDVVSCRECVARTILPILFLFFAPLPSHYSLLLLFSLLFFSFLFFSLVFFCERARAYVQRRPWTDDHVHIAAQRAVELRWEERKRGREKGRTRARATIIIVSPSSSLSLSLSLFSSASACSLCMFTIRTSLRRKREEKRKKMSYLNILHRCFVEAHFAWT